MCKLSKSTKNAKNNNTNLSHGQTNTSATNMSNNNDKESIYKQADNTLTVLCVLFASGRKLWCNNNVPSKTTTHVQNGHYLNTEELGQIALQCKQNGNYTISIAAYTIIMATYADHNGKIPIKYAGELFEACVCANEFFLAYYLISLTYDAIKNDDSLNSKERERIRQYFLALSGLTIEVVNNGKSTSIIHKYAACYSDSSNYSLIKSSSELIKEMRTIRKSINENYNQ